jgi:hypothetical protein
MRERNVRICIEWRLKRASAHGRRGGSFYNATIFNINSFARDVMDGAVSELADVTAKAVIYEAFVEGRLEAPKHLARSLHELCFEPQYEEFRPRTNLESFQCVLRPIQRTRPHSTVQSDSQAGQVPGSAVLTLVLVRKYCRELCEV